MIVRDTVVHRNIPFEDYLKLPGFSHSGIRMEGRKPFAATAKMNLGTNVHSYLLDPTAYSYENLNVVKTIALALKSTIGGLWEFLEPEIAVTSNFCIEDFILPYKGRIDLALVKRVILDIKVINGESVSSTIDLFHYDTQLSGYAASVGAKDAFIIAYSTKTKKVEVKYIPVNVDWWCNQIITKGNPVLI